jgi:hypothetical protein
MIDMGKNPKSYADRLIMAERAQKENDLKGAIVEYEFAMQLKGEPEIRKKIDSIERQIQLEKDHIDDICRPKVPEPLPSEPAPAAQ